MALLCVKKIKLRGTWALAATAGIVSLTHKQRHGNQKLKSGADTLAVSLDRDQMLGDGDALVAETGGHYLVRTRAERVLLVACSEPVILARLSWHCGARGIPVEIHPGGIIIPDNAANRRLILGLGSESEPVQRVFTPEISELIRPSRRC